jgi:hypothetical protein
MLDSVLNALFGCPHNRLTFPLTPGQNTKTPAAAQRRGAYIVCLDCGQEFHYNWVEMRMGEAVNSQSHASGAESYFNAEPEAASVSSKRYCPIGEDLPTPDYTRVRPVRVVRMAKELLLSWAQRGSSADCRGVTGR